MAAVSRSTEDLITDLCQRFPEDGDDLREALEDLRKQKLGTVQRLGRLTDGQWQRLGLPLGIESLIREEVDAAATGATAPAPAPTPTPAPAAPCGSFAPAIGASSPPTVAVGSSARPSGESARGRLCAAGGGEAWAGVGGDYSPGLDGSDDGQLPLEPYEPPVGLYQRRGGASGGQRQHVASSRGGDGSARGSRNRSGQGGLISPMELTPPDDLEDLWQQLLEDTLPPDKRQSLQDAWEIADDAHDRYMMFLEYSSYLRKPEVTEEEKAERRKQLEPLMRELGVQPDTADEESQSALVWLLAAGLFMLFAGVVYFRYTRPEPMMHDLQAL